MRLCLAQGNSCGSCEAGSDSPHVLKTEPTGFADGKGGGRMSPGWRSGTLRMPETGA